MEQYNILIVEDDKEIRDGIEIFLKSQNYNVFKAADGIEGLQVIDREDTHLAIVDIMMPRMDGVTMTMKLRERYEFPVDHAFGKIGGDRQGDRLKHRRGRLCDEAVYPAGADGARQFTVAALYKIFK